jgi:hypothetical protein
MTPKEKSQTLVNVHYKVLTKNYADNEVAQILAHSMWFKEAKEAALITVEELIKETGAKYWYDVKREIELL